MQSLYWHNIQTSFYPCQTLQSFKSFENPPFSPKNSGSLGEMRSWMSVLIWPSVFLAQAHFPGFSAATWALWCPPPGTEALPLVQQRGCHHFALSAGHHSPWCAGAGEAGKQGYVSVEEGANTCLLISHRHHQKGWTLHGPRLPGSPEASTGTPVQRSRAPFCPLNTF